MKIKNLAYNIKNAAYNIKNRVAKVLPFAMLVFTPVFKSCDKPEASTPHHKANYEYIMLDFDNIQMFRDEATREIVNKRNNGVVLYKLTESSKDAALNKITVDQWNQDIRPVLQDLNELAAKQVNNVSFKAQDTLFVNRADFDVMTERDSVGIGGGKNHDGADLRLLKYAGFKIIALNEKQY